MYGETFYGRHTAAVKSNKNQKWDPLRAMKTFIRRKVGLKGNNSKLYIQELWFLHSAGHPMLVNVSMKFHEDILNGFQVTERTALYSVLSIAKFFSSRGITSSRP